MRSKNIYILFLMVWGLGMVACKNWDDRLVSPTESLGKNLFEQISTQGNLSTFKDLLIKTGYDKVLSSSTNYTVFAPSNDALNGLSTTILSDTAQLKAFVGNHIALMSHNVPVSDGTSESLQMVNGKFYKLSKTTLGTATIASANTFASNGVLHTLSQSITVLPSLWKYISTNQTGSAQNTAIANLTFQVFNASKATIDSISATTGQPIYRPGTGFETVNAFTQNVYDLNLETKQYTYFQLKDASFLAEVEKLKPYFKTSTADSTYRQSAFATIKDLVFEGNYTIDQIPSVLKSKFGVNVTIDKSSISQTVKVSNGVVYVLDKITVIPTEKFPTLVVEGENFVERMPVSIGSAVIAVRNRLNPVTNLTSNSVSVIGHGNSGFWLRYQLNDVPSIKYKVYWVVINDLYNTNTAVAEAATFNINQKLAMASLSATTFAYPAAALPVKTYTEQLLGEYTVNSFGKLNLYLVANGTNAMSLDYIKLVPSF